MATFTVYPAIDLRQGSVVRLRSGDPEQQTVYGRDPLATARRWASLGATWLHVVNLDGAFDEAGSANWQLLPQLTRLGPKVQFGGGLRTLPDVERALQAGVSRVVLGTVAVEKPHIVAQAVEHIGCEHLAVGLDARQGQVRVRGWQEGSVIDVLELAERMAASGVRTVVHTDIGRDGALMGVNVTASASLARATGLEVIASGGVASMADVRQVKAQATAGLVGVIVGRALYEGRIDLVEALAIAARGSGEEG